MTQHIIPIDLLIYDMINDVKCMYDLNYAKECLANDDFDYVYGEDHISVIKDLEGVRSSIEEAVKIKSDQGMSESEVRSFINNRTIMYDSDSELVLIADLVGFSVKTSEDSITIYWNDIEAVEFDMTCREDGDFNLQNQVKNDKCIIINKMCFRENRLVYISLSVNLGSIKSIAGIDMLKGCKGVKLPNLKTVDIIHQMVDLEGMLVIKSTKADTITFISASQLNPDELPIKIFENYKSVRLEIPRMTSMHGLFGILLESLTITHSRIKSVPADFVELTNLRILDLSHNMISNIKCLKLDTMPNLISLNVSYNHFINKLSITHKNLSILDVIGNKISILELNIPKLYMLSWLNVSDYLSLSRYHDSRKRRGTFPYRCPLTGIHIVHIQ